MIRTFPLDRYYSHKEQTTFIEHELEDVCSYGDAYERNKPGRRTVMRITIDVSLQKTVSHSAVKNHKALDEVYIVRLPVLTVYVCNVLIRWSVLQYTKPS